jgi:hypothetical protein
MVSIILIGRNIMLKKNCYHFVLLFLCSVIAGCATNRSEIRLSGPATTEYGNTVISGPIAVIRSVKDERVFAESGPDPSQPSLGFGGASKAPADIKARAIGRKRNSYGKALGDVLLQNGQTVEGLIRENLAAALQQAGYQVKEEDADGTSALIIDVHIRQFWAWFQPGFWAIKLNTDIITDLDLSGAKPPVNISVHQEDARQMATDGAWMEIVTKALENYRTQATTKAATFPKSSRDPGII